MAKKVERQLQWHSKKLDLHEVMEFIRHQGAASIKEIKWHFHTDSASVREAMGFLVFHNKVWVLCHNRGTYLAENTGKRGHPSVPRLRKQAGVVERRRGQGIPKKPKVVPGERITQVDAPRE